MSKRQKNSYDSDEDKSEARLDVWLWRARFIKTRSEAARFITSGKVRLTRAGKTRRLKKAHTNVRPGDHITFMRAQKLFSVQVEAAGTRRGPAPEAQTLYSHTQPQD